MVSKTKIDTIYYYQSWKFVEKKAAKSPNLFKSAKTKFLDELDE